MSSFVDGFLESFLRYSGAVVVGLRVRLLGVAEMKALPV